MIKYLFQKSKSKVKGFVRHLVLFFCISKKEKIKLGAGFTLVEMMVAIAIFSLVMLVAIGAVLAIVGANKKAQSLTSVINNLNFAFEAMTRDLRTGDDYHCNKDSGDTNLPQDCPFGDDSIIFSSSQYGEKVIYSRSNNRIVKTIGSNPPTYLTAPEIVIENLKFYVVDSDTTTSSPPNYNQARILVVISGYAGNLGESSKFSIQTTVSQRRLDI